MTSVAVTADPITSDPVDRRLVGRLIAGDQAAFDEFFDTYFQKIYRFALRRLGDDSLAEDVAQTTLTAAVRGLASWRGEAALFTWLCTICRHEIHRHWRRTSHWPRVVALDDDPSVRAELESLASLADDPQRTAERAELRRAVQIALDYLPGHYGDVLEWKYVDGESVKDIATRLGSSPKAVESMLGRAREAFREGFAALAPKD
jgi:RNA polymerase sigma-70 factor (ECF subfamily)